MNSINKEIVDEKRFLGPGFIIGHSYFDRKEPSLPFKDWFSSVLTNEIAPLLKEYWFDDKEKAEELINKMKAA
jgi:5-methylcytosine-specific restriction protein B